MPLAFILIPLVGLLVTLVTAHCIAAGIFGFISALAVFGNFVQGGFQPCPECGSYLTTQVHETNYITSWVYQKCWHPKCRKAVGIQGIFVEQKHLKEEK
jgi:hypothetical protein